MSRITLLVVDDIDMNRAIIRKSFGDEYNFLEASNGDDAMKIIEKEAIEIVITDIFMEPMSGYELIKKIRNRDEYKKIPIIAITEHDEASRKKALKAGADDLLYKPFISRILNNRVKGLLFDGFDLNRYKLAYENNPIPFILYHVIDRPDTPNYKILYLNQAAKISFSPPFTEDLLSTDERPEHRDLLLKALRTGETQQNTVFEEEIEKWLDWTAYPDGNGLVAAMVHDITEDIEKQTKASKKEAEEAKQVTYSLREIMDTIPCGIFVFQISLDEIAIISVNEIGCKLIDIDGAAVIGVQKDTILSFVHPDDVSVVCRVMNQLAVPNTDADYECRLFNRTKNEYVLFAARAHSKQQPDGSVYAFICYVDITAKKQLEEAETKLAIAQKSNKAKTEFLSRMSHDMRTPLNGILGLIELTRNKRDWDEVQESFDQMALSGHYLLNLINDTLDISKIESGKLELHERPINSVEVMKNVLTTAQMMASNKGVRFKVIVPPIPTDKWVPIIADAARLEQILINIISNAVKYTPVDGSVEVEMDTISVTSEEVTDRYIIRDTGVGISEAFLPHIFEPFSQEGRSFSGRANGTGLGLNIVKSLVNLTGGEISIKSEVNVGTEVTLVMHYKRFNGTLEEKSLFPTDIIKEKRILLCEDHPLNAQIAMKLLERVGAKVDLASDGSLGLKMYEASEDRYYDAILMDVRMPVMDGLETTRRIRKSNKKDAMSVPIIAMTANALDEDVESCLLAGMTAHVSKPVEPDKLYETIARYLKKSLNNGEE